MTQNGRDLPIRVMHLITGLGVGGAETMLMKLLSGMDRQRFQNVVYSLTPPGAMGDRIRALGVDVLTLGMTRGRANPRAFFSLVRAIHRWSPEILQTWMYHADLMGGLAGRVAGNVPVIWNIRHSDLDPQSDKRLTVRVARACGRLSGWLPSRILCCAESSREIHERMGYLTAKMIVIPNGFDMTDYRPFPDAAPICEKKFGIPAGVNVISLIARFHPLKDHANFVSAARHFAARYPQALFVLCGEGADNKNGELMDLISQAGLEDKILCLGRRNQNDIALIMSRSLVTTSSSRGEAFPNVIGEAMACGTMCVVTDVGDSARIVGDTGIVVPPRAPEALSEGWIRAIEMGDQARRAMGEAARVRVGVHFGLPAVVSRYQELYAELARTGV